MKVEFTGRHIEVTEPIRKFTLDRLDRLHTINDIVEVHFILTAEKHQRHVAEVNLKMRNSFHNCKDESNDIYTSIASVLDKLEKQVQESNKRNSNGRRAEVKAKVSAADSRADGEREVAE